METCPICNNSLESPPTEVDDVFTVKCQKCGNYKLTSEAQANLKDTFLTERQAANISGWLVENESYEITTKNLDSFLVKLKPPSFTERADKLLSYIAHEAKYPGNPACFGIEYVSRAWCINECEFDEVVNYLIETKRIIHVKGSSLLRKVKVSSQGWIRLEELSKRNPESSQGFVAMWFNDTIKPLYGEAIAPAIRDAGYTPHRVDAREHNDKIDDEIISQIRRSKFVVADFTGHRGGVYFEAGFAKGLGLEVFWLCKEEDLENLHFDIRQYNCITWTDDHKTELRKHLALRIESVLGAGPAK